jgi:hypothetical protein
MREAEECFVQPSQREQRTSVSMFSSHLAKLVFLENTGYCSPKQCCQISFKNQIFNRATYFLGRKHELVVPPMAAPTAKAVKHVC